ncbi:DUF6864 domain-containing function [Providencia stuartii]|uniref:DUF6864 domain-containing function n=1 Tax=Providencia stuartii TaxID=588 RepID=UPI00331EED3D
MNAVIHCGNKFVISSGVFEAFDREKTTIEILNGMKINFLVKFDSKDKGSRIDTGDENGELLIEILNPYFEGGFGPTRPMLIASVDGKNVHLRFRVNLYGTQPGYYSYQITYTIYVDK